MAVTRKLIVKVLLIPLVVVVGIELFLQLGALIVAGTVRDRPTGWSTENTRVLALGDSNTFGIYLEEHESYPSQLEKMWNERHPDNLIEVLNLGYPGTNSFLVANSVDEIIESFEPDIVLLTIGVNDMFTASEYVEADPEAVDFIDRLNPITLLRRYSRLYKLIYITKQGGEAFDLSLATTKGQTTKPGDGELVKERELLKWSDDVEERMQNVLNFKKANVDTTDDSKGLAEAITFGDKKFSLISAEQNAAMLPTKLDPVSSNTEYGYHYLHNNIASIQKKVELAGADFYLLDYAASETFYLVANQVLRSYRDNNHDTRFIDVAEEFAKICPVSKECQDLFLPDFHPNKKGYEKVASLIVRTFEQDAIISK